MPTIWFDMDGTIADLYGVSNWLECLRHNSPAPYYRAKPLVSMCLLARYLCGLQKQGYQIGIVSWASKNARPGFIREIERAKRAWLQAHMPSVRFDYIEILPYGTPKEDGRDGILFDDEEENRLAWRGMAYDEKEILKILKAL